MIILDENVLDGQRLLLGAWRLAPRQIGFDLGRKGLKDEEIVVLLRPRRNCPVAPTARLHLLHAGRGFQDQRLRHSGYCIVVTGFGHNEVAAFIRRFLRHPDFDTQAKRMGRVVRISHASLAFWRLRSQTQVRTVWNGR